MNNLGKVYLILSYLTHRHSTVTPDFHNQASTIGEFLALEVCDWSVLILLCAV